MTSTLADIEQLARAVGQVPDVTQMSQAEVYNKINQFYQLRFPEELRLNKLKGKFTFYTTPNQDTYPFPQTFVTCEPPLYISGYPSAYYQDQAPFYAFWPQILFNQNVSVGNGGQNYAFTVSKVPMLPGTVIISDALGQETFTDNGAGLLIGSAGGGGLVSYSTGGVNVSYGVSLASGVIIRAQYWPYVPSRPQSVLFFQNSFILRPVPDQVYRVEIEAYRTPTALIASGDAPELNQWWELLGLGAAYMILRERMDIEQLAYCKPLLDEQMDLARRRTLTLLINQSAQTIFNTPAANYSQAFLLPYGG